MPNPHLPNQPFAPELTLPVRHRSMSIVSARQDMTRSLPRWMPLFRAMQQGVRA